MADEPIVIPVIVDPSGADKGLNKLKSKSKKAGETAGNFFVSGFSTELKALAGGFAGFQVVKTAIQSFRTFERELIKVGKTSDIAGQDLKRLGDSVDEMSSRIPLAQEDLLGLATVAGQFGVQGSKNILKFTETLAKLQFATDIVGEEGARSIAVLLGVTGEAATDVDKLGSVLVRVGNNVRATEAQILEVATEVGKVAGVFGSTSADAVAFGAALKALGIEAAAGGTAVGKVFLNINKATALGGERLITFSRVAGKSVKDFSTLFKKDATEAVKLFIKGLSQLPKTRVPIILKQLELGQDRVSKSLLPLVNNYSEFDRILKLTADELEKNTALDIEASKAFASLDAKLIIFVNSTKRLSKELGAKLAPILISILDLIDSFSGVLSNLVENIGRVIRVVLIFTAIAKAGVAFRALRAGFTSLKVGLAEFKIGMQLATEAGVRGFAKLRVAMSLTTIGLKALRIGVKLLKIGLTLGLSLVLDFLIEKLITLSDEAGGIGNLLKGVGLQIQIGFLRILKNIQEAALLTSETAAGFIGITLDSFNSLTNEINKAQLALSNLKGEFDTLPETGFSLGTGQIETPGLPAGGDEEGGIDPLESIRTIQGSLEPIKQGFADVFLFVENGSERSAKLMVKLAKDSQKAFLSIGKKFAVGFAQSFASVGAALVKGENAFEAFGKSILGVLGGVAIEMGTVYFLAGLASFNPGQAGLGLALIALGGALKALSGGAGSSPSVSGGGAPASPEADEELLEFPEQLEKQTAVTVNVEGAVLDPVGTGQQIVAILQETFDTTGSEVVTNVA